MANLHILGTSPADTGTYSGGAWVALLPLNNLKEIQPTNLARSTDATLASAQFKIDCGRPVPVSMFSFINHNFSSSGTIRIRVSNNSDGSSPTLDVTLDVAAPDVPWGSEPWGVFPWDGVSPDEQIGGAKFFYKHTSTVIGRYILVNIADTTNANGYVQAGRFKAGVPFVPDINMAYGAALSVIDDSRQSRSLGLQLWSDVKPKRRKFTAALGYLTETEAMGSAYDLITQRGLTSDLLIVYDPDDDDAVMRRRTIYGVFETLEPIITANASNVPYSWGLAVQELI